MNVVRVISPIVIIDVDGLMEPNLRMNQFQNSLNIQGEQYSLRGLIETLGYHFVAHALHTDGQWYLYDDNIRDQIKSHRNRTNRIQFYSRTVSELHLFMSYFIS